MFNGLESRLEGVRKKTTPLARALKACSVPILTQTVQNALFVAAGVREGYLLEGFNSNGATIKELLEASIKDQVGALAVLELGTDVMILNKHALEQKIMALQSGTAWDFTRHPLLIEVDTDLPTLCSESRVREISHILHGALQGNIELLATSRESVTQCTLAHYEKVEREASLPLLAGWLIGYPVCYRSVGDGRALSMQQLEKVALLVDHLPVMEFTTPLCLLEGESRSRLESSIETRCREIAAITSVGLATIERSVVSHSSEVL